LSEKVWLASDLEAYAATLREFAAAFPNDPRAAGFLSAAEMCPIKAVYAEQALLRKWVRLRPTKEDDIEARLRELKAFAAEHPQAPGWERLRTYETWLVSARRRFSDDGDAEQGVRKRLDRLFNSKFIREGHIFRDKDGRTYYLEKDTEIKDKVSKFGFKYFVGFNNELKSESKTPEELLSKKTQPPPQAELATNVRRTWQRAGLEKWNDYFLDLAQSVLKADQLDPFLRYLLLLKTLEFAATGDVFLEQELDGLLSQLNDDKLDRSVAWMDPYNEPAKKSRDQAKELLLLVSPGNLEEQFQRAEQRAQELQNELFRPRFAVGWLEKTRNGTWHVRTTWAPKGTHQLLVTSRPTAEGKCAWQSLGQMSSAEVKIDATAAQMAGEASVVFATPATSEPTTAQTH
jgi:hypothetical protein